MIRVSIEAAKSVSVLRPAGYMAELLSSGEIDDGFVVLTDDAYDRLLLRYSGVTRPCGPGCQLKRALEWWGLRDNGSCCCGSYAAQMDMWGPDECWRRLEEIVEHLRGAAASQGLPFIATAARIMVGRAIEAARKEVAHATAQGEEEAGTNLVRARGA